MMRGLLLLLCGILALVVAAEWHYGSGDALDLPSPTAVKPGSGNDGTQVTGDGSSFQMPPLESFEVLWRRPLFYEGRRPIEQGEGETPKVVSRRPLPPLRLKAILIVDQARYALVQDPAMKGRILRLQVGDTYQDWEVREIRGDRLVLVQAKTREELLLRHYEKVPLPSARRRKGKGKPVARKVPSRRIPRSAAQTGKKTTR